MAFPWAALILGALCKQYAGPGAVDASGGGTAAPARPPAASTGASAPDAAGSAPSANASAGASPGGGASAGGGASSAPSGDGSLAAPSDGAPAATPAPDDGSGATVVRRRRRRNHDAAQDPGATAPASDGAATSPAGAVAAPSATPAPLAIPDGDSAPTEGGETVVHVRRRRRPVTSTRTAAAEARRLPGTQGDAVRVVESLPGVGRSSFGSGELLLWGAAPDASRIFVDGVPIPLLFHGSGLRSTLNGFFVGNIELTPGGYGAEFGRATAGIVQIETAPLREGFHGYASADVLDASAAVSAQIARRWFVAGGVRYGYIDRLASLVAPRDALQYLSVPQYADYQLRAEYRIGQYERLTLFGFGSTDASQNTFVNDDPARARSRQQNNDFHRVVLRYTNRTSDDAQVAVNAWGGYDSSLHAETVGPYPSNIEQHSIVGGLRASWLRRVAPFLRVAAGVDVEASSNELSRQGSLLSPHREGDVFVFGQPPAGDLNADHWHVDQLSAAPYLELPFAFLNDHLNLTPGVRLNGTMVNVNRAYPQMGDAPTHGVARLLAAIEPRASATYRIGEVLTLKGAFGIYHAPPNPADLSAVFGNPQLGYVRSFQYVAGATVQILRQLSFEAVGFYRTMDSVVSRAPVDELRAGAALLPTGTARAYGIQATLRHTLFHGFTGWIAYTLSRSEVVDRPGADVRLSDYDQTHLLTAVASYELPLGFTVGARARLISGLPRTPVVGRFYDALTGDYQPLFGATNSDRLPPIVSVDVRVDKRFRIGTTELTAFLDVLNVLNQPAAEEIVYDSTYTQHAYISGLPILADLGLRLEF